MTSKLILATTAFAIGATLSALPAAADQIDRRQANQAKRIEQGIRSGELTRFEAAKLRAQQAHIRQLERKAERDGYTSPAERARILAALNAANRSIYAEKHDAQERRFGRRNGFGNHRVGDARRPWFRRWF